MPKNYLYLRRKTKPFIIGWSRCNGVQYVLLLRTNILYRNQTYIYRCIGSKRDRPGFNAEIQITFLTVHGVYAEKMFFLILTRNRKQLIYYREIREYVRIYLEFSAQTAYKNNLYSLGLMIKQALNFGTCYKDQKNVKPVGSLLWKEASQELRYTFLVVLSLFMG